MVLGVKRNLGRPLIFDVIIPKELRLNRPPSLMMYVNPQSFKQDYKKLKNTYQTLEGWIEEHHGDELDSIQCEATTAAFYTKDGITHIDRKNTEAYINFKDILELYKNNGKTYDSNGIPIFDGNIQITYDGGVYLGYFESFTYDDMAENPYRITFSFNFKIEETIYKLGT